MATITAFQPFNVDTYKSWLWQWPSPVTNFTEITVTAGETVQVYHADGIFTYHDSGITSGSIVSTTLTLDGVAQWTVTDVGRATRVLTTLIGDVPLLMTYVHGGSDTFNGSSGADTADGFGGNDILNGNAGNDVLRGSEGKDTLNGGADADTLIGGDGADKLNGGSGGDVLRGLDGADVLTGGANADRFDFDDPADTTGVLCDRITDFSRSQGDKIDLSTIDANGNAAGNGKFQLISGPFSGNSTGKLYFDAHSHTLFGSTDADTQAEFSIVLPTMNSIVVGDIIL